MRDKRGQFIKGDTGDKHNRWKGGRIKNVKGYILVYSPDHKHANALGYVYEHRLIAEKFLGYTLQPGHVVYHKNKILDDNNPDNLIVFKSTSAMMKYHRGKNCLGGIEDMIDLKEKK
jgi:hypothetical protein